MKKLLIFLFSISITFEQGGNIWNTWNTWNSWLGRMRYLVPTDNLALFVNPGAQMIDYVQGNKRYPALQYGINVYAEPTQTMASGKLYLFTFTSDATEGKVALSNSSISDSVSIVSGDNSFYVRADASSGTWGWNTTATITNKSFKQISNVDAPSTTVVDYSGNGNNGTAKGDLETNQPVYPYAWEFDGIDDRIDFGSDFGNFGANPFILNVWINITDDNNVGIKAILSKSDGASAYKGWQLYLNDAKVVFRKYQDYSSDAFRVSTSPLSNGWHFISVAYNSKDDNFIYVDAELQAVTIEENTLSDENVDNTANFIIGSSSYLSYYFQGKIAPVTVYLFDGQDGRANVMPSNYVDHYIKKIYNNTERYFK